jgi:hypothetical protein
MAILFSSSGLNDYKRCGRICFLHLQERIEDEGSSFFRSIPNYLKGCTVFQARMQHIINSHRHGNFKFCADKHLFVSEIQ